MSKDWTCTLDRMARESLIQKPEELEPPEADQPPEPETEE